MRSYGPMFESFGSRRPVSPDGVRWSVGRKWVPHRVHHSWRWRAEQTLEVVTAPAGWTDWFTAFDDTDLGGGLLILAGVVAVVLIAIPLLLFGIELIVAGVLVAVGIWVRLIFRKPWTIEARPLDASANALHWRVTGWKASGELITRISDDLAAGRTLTA